MLLFLTILLLAVLLLYRYGYKYGYKHEHKYGYIYTPSQTSQPPKTGDTLLQSDPKTRPQRMCRYTTKKNRKVQFNPIVSVRYITTE